jgi:hypothetical protein
MWPDARNRKLEDVCNPGVKETSMPASTWIINLVVLGVVLEADFGRRRIGWFRVLRPMITALAIGPLFLDSIPTTGHNVLLQVLGAAAGALLGLAAHLFVSVGYGPVKGMKATRNGPFSRAGFGYAAFWAVIFGGRLLFIYGSENWFSRSLGQFLASHELSAAGLTDALIFMALAMAVARSALLATRGRASARRAAGTSTPAVAVTSIH